jgi:DNA (cytosine-5)-methyltransferase 1
MIFNNNPLKGLSLFSNTGVAESLLQSDNIEILLANELDANRSKFYQFVYPNTKMICGDITNSHVFNQVLTESQNLGIDFIMATPPCQGMSTAGKQKINDERNELIHFALELIRKIKPKYALIENIPQQLKTKILIDNESVLIPDYIEKILNEDYIIKNEIINAADYGVPQERKRSIFLLTRKDLNNHFSFLDKSEFIQHITLAESIGNLPTLDPKIQGFNSSQQELYFPNFFRNQEEGLKISKWHRPPIHKIRHISVLQHTPEGCSALFNKIHFPQKNDGTRIRGYKNTYRRQNWNRPAYTITTYNGAICSHDNVHPGRPIKIGNEMLYSDARVFSIFELMINMSIPTDWNIPDWAPESLIRHSIGEGLPPLVVKKLIDKLTNN